jgi:hypothetical protein
MILEKDWITTAGLRAVVIICESNGRKTHRCGYVEVQKTSPFYGVDYSTPCTHIKQEQVDQATFGLKSPILLFTAIVNGDDENSIRRSLDIAIDVHGGLTYSGEGEEYPIPNTAWWFGFDCHHAGDAEIEPDPRWSAWEGVVRELDYVEAQCESLAVQLAALEKAAVNEH